MSLFEITSLLLTAIIAISTTLTYLDIKNRNVKSLPLMSDIDGTKGTIILYITNNLPSPITIKSIHVYKSSGAGKTTKIPSKWRSENINPKTLTTSHLQPLLHHPKHYIDFQTKFIVTILSDLTGKVPCIVVAETSAGNCSSSHLLEFDT